MDDIEAIIPEVGSSLTFFETAVVPNDVNS